MRNKLLISYTNLYQLFVWEVKKKYEFAKVIKQKFFVYGIIAVVRRFGLMKINPVLYHSFSGMYLYHKPSWDAFAVRYTREQIAAQISRKLILSDAV